MAKEDFVPKEKNNNQNIASLPPPELREELALLDSMIRYLLQIRIDIIVLSEQHKKSIPNLLTIEKLELAHSALLFLFFAMRGTRIASDDQKEEGKILAGTLLNVAEEKEKGKRGYA